ncbi:energy transducer TonB [Methylosinus sp. H3A]|nr:energy transducer TonB [Methylosinus sp. H3A]
MSDQGSPTREWSGREADWLAVARPLEVRWLVAVTVMVPALLAVGVYLLRHAPSSSYSRAQDSIIDVRLLPPREHVDRTQEPPPRNGTASAMLPERFVERSEPTDVAPNSRPTPRERTVDTPSATEAPAASPTPILASDNRAAVAFQKALLAHIARFRRYPEEARRAGQQGTVQVLFAMRRDGAVTDVQIRTSSGQSALDAAAAETIRRAQPLPRIPRELPDRLTILAPIAFDML